MLADLSIFGLRQSLAKKDKAVVVDFGSGILSLEKVINEKLTPEEKERIEFIGVDISEDLLRYGLEKCYIDLGIKVDLSQKSATELEQLLPDIDVAIFAEILENIPKVGQEFKEKFVPLLRKNSAYIIGRTKSN